MAKKDKPSNLKPFKKGIDPRRNTKGQPPKLPALDMLMAKILGREKDGQTAAEAILINLFNQANKGNLKAAEMLLDRGYGKPKQQTDITSNGETIKPISLKEFYGEAGENME